MAVRLAIYASRAKREAATERGEQLRQHREAKFDVKGPHEADGGGVDESIEGCKDGCELEAIALGRRLAQR